VRVGRGVSVQTAFGSFIATVVEAEIDAQGEVHLRRVISAVDTWHRRQSRYDRGASSKAALIFGLTAALYGEIDHRQGPASSNPISMIIVCCAIDQVPKIEVHLIRAASSRAGSARPA